LLTELLAMGFDFIILAATAVAVYPSIFVVVHSIDIVSVNGAAFGSNGLVEIVVH
jgi:hypothetical protein